MSAKLACPTGLCQQLSPLNQKAQKSVTNTKFYYLHQGLSEVEAQKMAEKNLSNQTTKSSRLLAYKDIYLVMSAICFLPIFILLLFNIGRRPIGRVEVEPIPFYRNYHIYHMNKFKKVLIFNKLWDQEKGLSVMFALLIMMHFVIIPLFGSYSSFMVLIYILRMLFLFAGIFTLARSAKEALLLSIIPIFLIIFSSLSNLNAGPVILLIEFILSVTTFLLLVLLVLKKVFEPGPINGHRIVGSIVIYMAMAHIWMIVYVFFYENIPGAFQISLTPFEGNSSEANFLYFSYVTISTTGFGEILPLHPLVRAMVNMEAVFGVLYPVILIGRLVSYANSKKQI